MRLMFPIVTRIALYSCFIFHSFRISSDQNATPVQIIGNYNVFEVDSTCEASKVGDNNILESKGRIKKTITYF